MREIERERETWRACLLLCTFWTRLVISVGHRQQFIKRRKMQKLFFRTHEGKIKRKREGAGSRCSSCSCISGNRSSSGSRWFWHIAASRQAVLLIAVRQRYTTRTPRFTFLLVYIPYLYIYIYNFSRFALLILISLVISIWMKRSTKLLDALLTLCVSVVLLCFDLNV